METLSHGNQQRVQLIAALVHDPELLVLDEPLSGLDPTGIDAIGQVLVDQARAGCCVLFSSHQLDQVEDLCEQVTIIDHGRLVVSGTVDELATSGARRLVVRIEGDRTGDWARQLPGVTVSEVERWRRAPGPGELGRQRRRPPCRDASRDRSTSSPSSVAVCPRCSGRRWREVPLHRPDRGGGHRPARLGLQDGGGAAGPTADLAER